MTDEQVQALRLAGTWDQVHAMIQTLAAAVAAADLYLNSYDTSAPSRIKAETRALVEEAMGLLRPRP
jgi:glycine cleavage system regulatory protein